MAFRRASFGMNASSSVQAEDQPTPSGPLRPMWGQTPQAWAGSRPVCRKVAGARPASGATAGCARVCGKKSSTFEFQVPAAVGALGERLLDGKLRATVGAAPLDLAFLEIGEHVHAPFVALFRHGLAPRLQDF